MTLKKSVEEVIEQNKDCKYNPQRFRQMTKNGEANDLDRIISNLVLDPNTLDTITNTSKRYKGKPIFIEEFISMYGFSLPDEVINEAQKRTEAIQKLRWLNLKGS